MNPNIHQLYQIAQKPSRHIIGLMSGTSLDGLDIALCKIQGNGLETSVSLLEFQTIEYDDQMRQYIQSVFAKKQVSLEQLTLLNGWIGQQHGQMVLQCLEQWKIKPETIDLIAGHGQTIYHAPKFIHPHDEFSNATLQIGDGDHLARESGIITICDFRQKHIAAGGEGAPLAVYGDYLVFSNKDENRVLLNLGGLPTLPIFPNQWMLH